MFNCNQTNIDIESSVLFKKNSLKNFNKTSLINLRNSEKYSKFFKIESFHKENEILKEKNSDRISIRNVASTSKNFEEFDPFEEYLFVISNIFSENIKDKLNEYEKKSKLFSNKIIKLLTFPKMIMKITLILEVDLK
jgi:hypothetical protein